jgi:hypothetical protein
MSEGVYDSVVTETQAQEAFRALMDLNNNKVVELQAKVVELESLVTQQNARLQYSIDSSDVRTAIIELACSLQGVSEPSDLDDDNIESLNETLNALGLMTVEKKFSLAVVVTVRYDTEVEVVASSLEEAIQSVENGDYETEILDNLDGAISQEIESYNSVEDGS